MLLQDQKSHEELCISKYQSYANQAKDPALAQLFRSLSGKEQEHLNSVNQILSGQIPVVQPGSQSGQSQMQTGQGQTQSGQSNVSLSASDGSMQQGGQIASMKAASGMKMEVGDQTWGKTGGQTSGQSNLPSGGLNDSMLCKDMLSTEKHVSSAYNTAIFECTNTGIRQVLNHIQKEEQEHGEQIFKYMQSNGMYSVQ